MRYINDPEFVKRMDAFFEQPYHMKESNLRQGELEKFWKEFRGQVKDAYKDSDKWVSFYNVITGIVDEYEE